MKIISVANQKGGVSKSTTAQALLTIFNNQNKKTIAIDLDPQSNLSYALNANTMDVPTIYDLMKGDCEPTEVLQVTHSGDLLPSNILLSGADTEFTTTGREYILKELIYKHLQNYEYVIIDCPPALNILTINAFVASDYIVVPSMADIFSLQGMSQLNNTILSVKKYCNSNLKIAGILLTKFNPRTNLSNHIKESLSQITTQIDTKLFETTIRNSVSIQESQLQQENILISNKKSTAISDYEKFILELEEIING